MRFICRNSLHFNLYEVVIVSTSAFRNVRAYKRSGTQTFADALCLRKRSRVHPFVDALCLGKQQNNHFMDINFCIILIDLLIQKMEF